MRRIKSFILFLIGFLFASLPMNAEETMLHGRVVSTDGRPLEGVIVSASGHGGTITDAAGAFVLDAAAVRGTLRVSLNGWYPREFPLGKGRVPEVIVLVPVNERDYSGQVVMPDGVMVRDEAPATASTTFRKDMGDSPSADLSWQDVDAALTVIRKSGMPGEGGYYHIRGIHSLTADATPLVVVDGVPLLTGTLTGTGTGTSDVIEGYSRDALFGYNAHDIRSITVLKGADAARYGSLGAAGVILVETEQATSDRLDTRISYSGSFGLSQPGRSLPVLGVGDYQNYLMEVGQTRYPSVAALQRDYPFLTGTGTLTGTDATPDAGGYYAYLFNNNTDWTSSIYRRALVTDNVLRVEGGDEVAKYNISFGYTSEDGVLGTTSSDRFHTAMNTHIMVSPTFEITTSVNLAYINGHLLGVGGGAETNPILSAYRMMPNLSPYEKLPSGALLSRLLSYDGWNVNANPSFPYDNVSNPMAIVGTVQGSDKTYDAHIRLGADYRLGAYWTLSGLVNLCYDYTEEYMFVPGVIDKAIIPQLYGTGKNSVAMGVVRQNATFYHLSASYRKTFADIHRLHATAGIRLLDRSFECDASSGFNTANDYFRTLSKVADEWTITGNNDHWHWLSAYAHGDYTLDSQLRLSAGLSVDGSSASGIDAPRFGLFPSLSVTWMAAGSGRLPDCFDHLNITAETSLTGNSRFSTLYARNCYVSSNLFNLGTIVRRGVPNTHLTWEKKFQTDLGVDMALWGNRLGLQAGAFYALGYDLLLPARISAVYGSGDAYYANAASVSNVGFEASLRLNPVHTPDFDWVITASAASVSSTVADLGGTSSYVSEVGASLYASSTDDAQLLLQVGSTPWLFYGYQTKGVYATTAEAQQPTAATGRALLNPSGKPYVGGDVIFVDQNGDGVINDDDRVALGSARPRLYGTFGTSVRWRAFILSADLAYSLGAKAYNATRRQVESMDRFYNQSTAVLGRWQVEGQHTSMPRTAYGDPSGNNLFSDRWIEDASYLKLRTVRLGYTLPRRLFGIVGGIVWAAAENAGCFTDYLGGDPEFAYSCDESLRGIDYAKVTIPRTFKLGFNLDF